MFAKTWRVHAIFKNVKMKKKVMKMCYYFMMNIRMIKMSFPGMQDLLKKKQKHLIVQLWNTSALCAFLSNQL